MFTILVFSLFVLAVNCEEKDKRLVILDEGPVFGEKYWKGDFYEFYGIPYASVPTGRDRFKGPLPPIPWTKAFIADDLKTMCQQTYYTGEDSDDVLLDGVEECLVMNVLTPIIANETNPVPVIVYVHSGAYSGGKGNMAKYHYLARRDIVVVSYNYRLGAIGFACLGNEEIPGNAGMKDQVAALRWINKNIQRFGGDPNKVTLAGFSVGAAMAELLALSKTTEDLIDKLILESGSALSPYSINRDPIATATNIAKSIGYNGTSLEDLTEFYINADIKKLAAKSVNFFLPNSTFGFVPCIENVHEGIEPFITEDPLKILSEGRYHKLSVVTGFSNMEGISRTIVFKDWYTKMNENLADFLPADLKFDSDSSRDDFVKKVKKYYFNNKEINENTIQEYIDYFSDSMFKYSILKSARLHAAVSMKPVFFYEFSFVGTLNMKHNYMDKIKGASHRDQSSYVLDFFSFTSDTRDLIIRDRMTWMWSDFVKYGHPTAYESELVEYKWLPLTNENSNYLQIDFKTEMKKDVFSKGYEFWNQVYEKYYWTPKAPVVEPKIKIKLERDEKAHEGEVKLQEKKNEDETQENHKKHGSAATDSAQTDGKNKKEDL